MTSLTRPQEPIITMKLSNIAFLTFATLAAGSDALLTNPMKSGAKAVNKVEDRAYVTRDIKTPDPVPEEGQMEALELMKTGRMYRYNVKSAEESVVSQCEEEIAAYDVHSPARVRVRGMMANSEEFAKAFQCPKGAKMNPEEKCKVW